MRIPSKCNIRADSKFFEIVSCLNAAHVTHVIDMYFNGFNICCIWLW